MTAQHAFGIGFLEPSPDCFGAQPTSRVRSKQGHLRFPAHVHVGPNPGCVSTAPLLHLAPSAIATTLISLSLLVVPFLPAAASGGVDAAHGSQAPAAAATYAAAVAGTSDELSLAQLEQLAETEPNRFLVLLESGTLRPTTLSFAAEFAVLLPDRAAAVAALDKLSHHVKSYVREGAVLGLARLGTEVGVARLRQLANSDPDADVRATAAELLDGAIT